MAGFFKRIKVVHRNKYEIYLSVVAVAPMFWPVFTSHPSPLASYGWTLAGVGLSAVAFFSALNAILDARQMSVLGRCLASIWFAFVSVLFLFALVRAVAQR
jgi:hypothetical protein